MLLRMKKQARENATLKEKKLVGKDVGTQSSSCHHVKSNVKLNQEERHIDPSKHIDYCAAKYFFSSSRISWAIKYWVYTCQKSDDHNSPSGR